MIKWIHISEEIPQSNRVIIRLHPPYDSYENATYKKHWTMGMAKHGENGPYDTVKSLENLLSDSNIPYPDYWWVYAEDFPFPEYKDKHV